MERLILTLNPDLMLYRYICVADRDQPEPRCRRGRKSDHPEPKQHLDEEEEKEATEQMEEENKNKEIKEEVLN